MRIIIDLQGAQLESQGNPTEQYLLLLTEAIIRNKKEHDIIILLNGLFPESIDVIRSHFKNLLSSPQSIQIWEAPGPVAGHNADNVWRREVAERIREAFIAHLKPDLICLTSIFEGYHNEAVSSINQFSCGLCTVVALTHPVPLINPQDDTPFNLHLLKKIHYLQQAHHYEVLSPDANYALPIEHFNTEALRLIKVFNNTYQCHKRPTIPYRPMRRLKLAYVSPLPPNHSGISYYSIDLLHELSRYYEIDVIIHQDSVSTPWIQANCPIRTVDWFKQNSQNFDRVLYHMGNSPFHAHMLGLMKQIKGVVVLHDYFLIDLLRYQDAMEFSKESGQRHDFLMINEIFRTHGYHYVSRYFHSTKHDPIDSPCNGSILEEAMGVIVHSKMALQLAREWRPTSSLEHMTLIPLLRPLPQSIDRTFARQALQLQPDDFVVCSFGLIQPSKLNHRLLEAWLSSTLAHDKQCILIFVGEAQSMPQYHQHILDTLKLNNHPTRVVITGWVDENHFNYYLAAADIGVQLREQARGKASATILDCMNYSLPTIINTEVSVNDLPENSVWRLATAFNNSELVYALETLRAAPARREAISQQAKLRISSMHSPQQCAQRYIETIEMTYEHEKNHNQQTLINAISALNYHIPSEQECLSLTKAIARAFPNRRRERQLLIDISEIVRNDLKTGIQRVVRALLLELIHNPPLGYRVEPVYFSDIVNHAHLKYARKKTLEILECPSTWSVDQEIDMQAGDILLALDFSVRHVLEAQEYLSGLNQRGMKILFVVYDLLPILLASKFPENSEEMHQKWLHAITQFDGALCISNAVSTELKEWIKSKNINHTKPFHIQWFHLGANIQASAPTKGIPENASSTLALFEMRPTFLMVGTIEPRKGHTQTIAAFDLLWEKGVDVNLVIVGKRGWMVDNVIQHLTTHPQLNQHLFFLEQISDEYLDTIYKSSHCLIAASEGEGFGLPLIEASQHKLPILARDIPVFREIAGTHAFYFDSYEPHFLAETIQQWLELYAEKKHPRADNIPWLTWCESATKLKELLLQI